MSGYPYKGAQDVGSAASEYNVRKFHSQQDLASVRTVQIAQVINPPYDANGNPISPGAAGPIGFVDVQVLVNQWDGYGNSTPHGTTYRLPYLRYQGSYGAFISDPKKGDVGLVLVCDRDISAVKKTGTAALPGSRRKHDLADGIYLGSPIAGAPAQYFAWLNKGFNITDAYGNTIVGAQDGVLVNGCLINQAGDVVTKKGTDLDRHEHGGVMTGGGTTGPPVGGGT